MSRFFASADYSDSQSDSEITESDFTRSDNESEFSSDASESGYSSEGVSGEEGDDHVNREQEPVRKSRFLFGSDSDSDEDDSTMRVVKSHREKIEETLNASIACLRDLSEQGNWTECQKELDDFARTLSKSVQKGVPDSVFMDMESLNDFFASLSIDRKNMPALEFKSYTAFKQKFRKMCVEYGDNISKAKSAGTVEETTKAAGKKTADAADIKDDSPLAKLKIIMQAKSKKGVDRMEKISGLKALLSEATTDDFFTAQVLIALLTAELEIPNTTHDIELWRTMVSHSNHLIRIIPTLLTSSNVMEYEGLPTVASLRGTLLSFALRMDDNFVSQLHDLDSHTKEYTDYLKELSELVKLLNAAADCFAKLNMVDFEVQVQAKLLDHLSYLHVDELAQYGFAEGNIFALCKSLYVNAPENIKVKALMNHVYFLAVNDQASLAKEMLISSKLPESIHSMDTVCQIQYNRCLAAIGLASFRLGQIRETYFLLQDLCSSGRPKELLGQGTSQHRHDKQEPERAAPKHIPLHQHMNIELLDSVFLTSSMILEIPLAIGSVSKVSFPEKRNFQSRHLKRLIDNFDRNLFHGPPENNREHIVVATKLLSTGNWQKAFQLIADMDLWEQFHPRYEIKQMLKSKIRLSGFYCQLFAYSGAYCSLDVSHLDADFADLLSELPQRPDFPEFEKYFSSSKPGYLEPKFRESDHASEGISTVLEKANFLAERLSESIPVGGGHAD